MSGSAWTALGVALYGAFLSSLLAFRQIWLERRRLRIIARQLIWSQTGATSYLEVLEVRALNERRRPIFVRQAGVITVEGVTFHPMVLKLDRKAPNVPTPPVLLNDGEHVSFYFDLLSFESENYLPKAVWVQDQADRRYKKRLKRKERRQMAADIVKLRERLGPDVESQQEFAPDTYSR